MKLSTIIEELGILNVEQTKRKTTLISKLMALKRQPCLEATLGQINNRLLTYIDDIEVVELCHNITKAPH